MRIVFDLAGVVFHWSPPDLLRSMLPGHAPDDAAAHALVRRLFQGFGPDSDWAGFDRGQIEPDALAERIARRTGIAAEDVRAVIDAIPAHLHAHAGTVDLMRRMRRAGHRLFYLSNMPAPYALHLEREHDLFALFDAGVFSARVGLMKPDPAIFEAAARRFGAAPADLLFIDDVARNVEAARALGWQALQFRDAADCEAALPAGVLGPGAGLT